MTEHTPTPWRVIIGDDYYIAADAYPKEFSGHFKSDDTGDYLAWVGNRPADFGEANAAYIVKACNAYPDLVKALEDTLCELSHCATQLAARGLPGREGDSVSRALEAARRVLRDVKSPSHPEVKP